MINLRKIGTFKTDAILSSKNDALCFHKSVNIEFSEIAKINELVKYQNVGGVLAQRTRVVLCPGF